MYEKLLNAEGKLQKMDLKYCRVWNGCGTFNCHTYPTIPDNTDIIKLVKDCYEILEYIKDDINKLDDMFIFDWEFDSNNNLKEINNTCMHINMIISFAILLYGKEKAIYILGKIFQESLKNNPNKIECFVNIRGNIVRYLSILDTK